MTDIDFFYNYNEDSSKHAEGRVVHNHYLWAQQKIESIYVQAIKDISFYMYRYNRKPYKNFVCRI